MLLPVHKEIQSALVDVIRGLYNLADPPACAIELPPTRALGDLAIPVAFQLARQLRKAPRAIAQELAGAFDVMPGVARVEAAPNGYLNVFLDRPAYLRARLGPNPPAMLPGWADKTVVEHTAINPNKAAHIGHLRNAALGDTLVRALRFRGTPVEVQNYIDDTGVQVADVVVGLRELEGLDATGVRRVADTTRFDFYCWDVYARVTAWYEADAGRLTRRAAALHEIERGEPGNPTAEVAAFVADRSVRAHLATMARLNIGYDLLTWEGDILRLQFWARAFEILKERKAVFLQDTGKLAGCWVMRIEDGAGQKGEGAGKDAAPPAGRGEPEQDREKVIVRSNGTVTYVGKDIAYQFWKLGLLDRDFRYRAFGNRLQGGRLWSTTSNAGEPGAPPFGRASRIYNVIDVRQSYLQELLKQALRTLGYHEQADHSVHFSYEMVALSHATARELGQQPSGEESSKPFVEVSGRRGTGVKADDLLDLLIGKASAEVAKRNPALTQEELQRTSAMIAVAAVRYFMIKYSLGKVIAFDIEEALSFEGESGPYLQYAVVRANNIFRKLRERDLFAESSMAAALEDAPAQELDGNEPHDLWGLVLEASRLDEVVDQVVRTLEFSVLAKYAFGLAQVFNAFYHRSPILNESRADRRLWRAAGVAYVRDQLTRALDLMGIEIPDRM